MREMINSGIEWLKEIPRDWKIERLQWHMYEINDKNSPIKTTNVLSLTNKRGVIPYEEKGAQGNISKENYNEYKIAYKDTIVANSMNILIGSVGYSNYEGCVSPVYYVFKEKDGNDLRFLNYILQTVQFQKELRKYANGILEIRLRVSSNDILKRQAAFPSLDEQKHIAAFLDKECSKIDSIYADVEKQIETLEQYKRSVITEAVTRGLNPNVELCQSGIDYIDKTPKHWTIKRLKYILTERNERSITGTETLLSVSQYLGVIPSSDNKMRTMQADSLVGYKIVKKDDLVFNKLNPGLARFGWSNYDGITSPDFAVYVVDKKECSAKFLQYLLKTERYVTSFKGIGLGVGDGFARLYTPQLYNYFVSIPAIDELNEIVAYLEQKCAEIESVIADKKKQLEVLENYKKSLIYEYVTGKKEVVNE